MNMHPHERAFVQAILEEPGERAHRLVFGDWLKEHGREEHVPWVDDPNLERLMAYHFADSFAALSRSTATAVIGMAEVFRLASDGFARYVDVLLAIGRMGRGRPK